MNTNFVASTTYFLREGRENLPECLKVAFQAALQRNIKKIVIFTAYGEGIKLAIHDYISQPAYADLKLVGVTFPAGKKFRNQEKQPIEVRIADDVLTLMQKHHVPLIRAHLPFDSIEPGPTLATKVGAGFNIFAEALNIFCGGMSLCVQSATLACDAGWLEQGEHIISLTSDTAILVQAATTQKMLSQLVIREILCKPAILTIGRNEVAVAEEDPPPVKILKEKTKQKKLR